ncbi:hypothetical protein [Acinetobacter rathckeae]|uniref:hypothetical protein n=1 Tax=Acinetobacter rathckeae TaxID=2605272 RepID=UPI0018A2CFB3|nr:hypothetical protein [Acinetobacter rathckeae]MBF7696622.1 hypothetical protein [Acinetobacter rathckeae]
MTQYKATSPIGRFAIGDIVSDFSDRQIAIYINQGLIKKVESDAVGTANTSGAIKASTATTAGEINQTVDKDKNTDGK